MKMIMNVRVFRLSNGLPTKLFQMQVAAFAPPSTAPTPASTATLLTITLLPLNRMTNMNMIMTADRSQRPSLLHPPAVSRP